MNPDHSWRTCSKQTNTWPLQHGCQCHIRHICINNEVKALRFDVKVEFSSSARGVTGLTRVFEMDYQELPRHLITRCLSLLPAVARILHSWPAPRSNFLSTEGEPSSEASCCTSSPEGGQSLPSHCELLTHLKLEKLQLCSFQQQSMNQTLHHVMHFN